MIDLPLPTGELARLVLLFALKATLILGAAALLSALLARSTAAVRHLVWSSAIAALLLLPVFSLALPDWRVPLWPERVAEIAPRAASLAREAAAPSLPRREAPAASTLPRDEEALTAPAPAAGAAESSRPRRPLGEWVALVWLAGIALVVARLLAGQLGLRRLRRHAAPVDPSFRWLAREMAGHLELHRTVEMLRSPTATMPMTWGVMRPTILFPAEADGWPLERRRAVLLHELAHVKRFDCLTQTLALLCCGLYWFHPGVWWAARRMRVERETACDDAVLGAGVAAAEYATQLLEIARAHRASRMVQVAAVAMARPSQLEGRLLAVLDAARSRAGVTRRVGWTALGAALALLLPVSALHPTARAADRGTLDALAQDTVPRPPLPVPAPDAPDPAPYPAPPAPHTPFAVEVEPGPMRVEAPAAVPAIEPAAHAMAQGMVHPVPPAHPAEPPRAPAAVIAGTKARKQADPRAVAALVAALRDSDAQVRRTAAQGLGELDDPTAVEPLVAALRDENAGVRRAVAWALGEIDDRRAVDGLSAALRDADAEVRKTAAWALGEIDDPRSAGALATLLRDSSPEVRKTAAWALSEMEDPAAVPALLVALRDDSPEVRTMAAHALGEIGDARAVEPLIAALRDSASRVRSTAGWALGEIGDPRAAAPLAAALADAPADAKRSIVHALSELDVRTAPQPLLDAIRDADVGVRRAVAHALGEIGDPRALPALRSALRDQDVEVRRTVMRALVEMDDPNALDVLIEALKDADAEIRRQAARGIANRR